MKDNNSDMAIGGYSEPAQAVSGFTSLVTGILENLQGLVDRMRHEQAQTRDQLDRKRAALCEFHQQSSKRMPLEKLIRMGFYHF